jgi:hypothetical protein
LKYKITPLAERLKVLVGESRAGNNSNMAIIAEGTAILNKLIKAGVMTREQAEAVLKKLH